MKNDYSLETFTDILINLGIFARLVIVSAILFVPSFLIYMAVSAWATHQPSKIFTMPRKRVLMNTKTVRDHQAVHLNYLFADFVAVLNLHQKQRKRFYLLKQRIFILKK